MAEEYYLEDIVCDAREWTGYEEIREYTGIMIPMYCGEQLDGNTVMFEAYEALERITFKGRQLYLVTDWGVRDA